MSLSKKIKYSFVANFKEVAKEIKLVNKTSNLIDSRIIT